MMIPKFTNISIGILLLFSLFAVLFPGNFQCEARKHHLIVENDIRRYFPISTFGYFAGGSLEIRVNRFKFRVPTSTAGDDVSNKFGFTLAKTLNNNLSPYLEGRLSQHSCLLNEDIDYFSDSIGLITFKFDFKNNKVDLRCNSQLNKLNIFSNHLPVINRRRRTKRASLVKNTNLTQNAVPSILASAKSQNAGIDNASRTNHYEPAVVPDAGAGSMVEKSKHNSLPESNPPVPGVVVAAPAAPVAPVVPVVKQEPAPGVPVVDHNKDNLSMVPNNEDEEPAMVGEDSDRIANADSNKKKKENPPKNSNEQDETEDEAEKANKIKYEEANNPDYKNPCFINSFEMKKLPGTDPDEPEYSFQFQVFVQEQSFEGLYALYFHNCLNYPSASSQSSSLAQSRDSPYSDLGGLSFHQLTSIDLDLSIVEKNLHNYLSAGQIPLPQLYFALSVIFFILGIIWFYSLSSRNSDTFKIHYLMGFLVFVKALSLLFHGINYYFIAKEGSQVETWAVLYYITHFLKGALLFITIVLIGTGWAFIKHILSDKDKKIFMIVIPLQVIANIADIITEESEEGALIHTVWREIFILVDLICCGAILFPVIWSIRHLQEASQTDGKAAINLKKLQLFRHFYVMIVFYIYFTRIIVYLMKITVPFKYEWLDALFQHSATLVFFVFTGYHFQPTGSNPYYQLLQDEIEMDEEVLFIQPSTFSEAKKRNRDLESSDVQSLIGGGSRNSRDYD